MPVLSGSEGQATGQADNVVRVDDKSTPSGGGQGSKVGTSQQQQVPFIPSPKYDPGGDFYYHPSQGVGTMTGVWGDPRAGGARRHEGQDIRMPMNTPLVAVTSGTIKWYKNSSAGTVIYLLGDDGNKYSYFHMNKRIAKNGQRVQGGQVIGTSGNTGNSSGPHLHFEVWWNGKKVDPRTFLSHTQGGPGPVDPTQGDDPYFDQEDPVIPRLDVLGQEDFYDDAASIFGSFGEGQVDPNQPYGQWANDLRALQSDLAAQGVGQSPRKIKASALLRSTIQGMAGMVRRDGYTSNIPAGGSGGGQYSTPGSNVVAPPQEG